MTDLVQILFGLGFFPSENKEEPQRSIHERLSLELTVFFVKKRICLMYSIPEKDTTLNPACDIGQTITLTESLISIEKSKNLFWVCLEWG